MTTIKGGATTLKWDPLQGVGIVISLSEGTCSCPPHEFRLGKVIVSGFGLLERKIKFEGQFEVYLL